MAASTQHAVHEVTTSHAFERFARTGYVARGVIYALMGILAIQLARGVGGEKPSQEGAMRLIADQTFGRVLLLLVALGLAGYAALRFTQAFVGRTSEAGRFSTFDRIAAFGSACAYTLFLVIAISLLVGSAGGGGGGEPKAATADALGWPAGQAIVFAAGALFVGVGAYQAYLGISRKFLSYTKTEYMSQATHRRFTALGVVGHFARAVTFGLVGIFLVKAAVQYDPQEAVGIDGALQRLTTHAYGTVALIAVAVGLIAFGIYSVVDARYRAI